jgi:hypothetical protein
MLMAPHEELGGICRRYYFMVPGGRQNERVTGSILTRVRVVEAEGEGLARDPQTDDRGSGCVRVHPGWQDKV